MLAGKKRTFLAALAVSGTTFAASAAKVEQKCYLHLENQGPRIVHFVLDEEKAEQLPVTLPFTRLRLEGSPMVLDVRECVSVSKDFASKAAQKLERRTLR